MPAERSGKPRRVGRDTGGRGALGFVRGRSCRRPLFCLHALRKLVLSHPEQNMEQFEPDRVGQVRFDGGSVSHCSPNAAETSSPTWQSRGADLPAALLTRICSGSRSGMSSNSYKSEMPIAYSASWSQSVVPQNVT